MSLKGAIKKLESRYKQYQVEEEKRAQARISKLATRTAREEERAKLQERRLKAKRKLELAKTQLKKAELERKEISRKTGSTISDALKMFQGSSSKSSGKKSSGKKKGKKKESLSQSINKMLWG